MASLSSVLKLTVLDGVTGPMRRIGGVLSGFNRQQTAAMAPLRGIGGQLLAFGGAYLGVTKGISSTVGAAIKFESAFADVKKVVDASDEQFENFARTIKQMSRELPLSSVEIAQLWAAAGESNIPVGELKAFSEMAARVGIAFDMSAGEAGESLAKLKSQLGLTVGETGEMADAINHLSNNMASKAKDITAYMLRVGKFGEMSGFTKDQVAAIGSAMISAGAEAETAGTAMMNVVRKMTSGEFAKKDQKEAAKALGLDLPTLAKQMKKDAPKALKTVLQAIAKAPAEKQIALLSKFFGDEARAFAPLVGNIGLLDRAFDLVADRANYAGSAFKEFVARANTTENALKLLRNKVSFFFEDIGAAWLPEIKVAVAEIGGLLDTLGSRASVFDEIKYALKGFTQGLGYDGGIKEVIRDLGDLLFGKEDPSGAADRLGGVFAKFEGYGKSVRELSDAIRENPIAQFLGDLAGPGLKLALAAGGIALAASAISKLARAILFLTGITTAIGILKTIGKVGGILTGVGGAAATTAAGAGTGAAAGGIGAALAAAGRGIGGFLKRNPWGLAGLAGYKALDAVPHDAMASATKDDPDLQARLMAERNRFGGVAFEGGRHRAGLGAGPQPGEETIPRAPAGATVGTGTILPSKVGLLLSALSSLPSQYQQDRPVTLDTGTINQIVNPRGIQDVRVTNKEPPQIHLSVTQNITGVSSPEAAADAAASRLGQAVKAAYEAADTD